MTILKPDSAMILRHICLCYLFSFYMIFLPSALSSQDKEMKKEYQQPFFFSNYFAKYGKINENTKNKPEKQLVKKYKIREGSKLISFFSKPLLDRDETLEEAEIQEVQFREVLKKKKVELSLMLCKKKDVLERERFLNDLKSEHKRQITLWGKMQERYTRSMRDYLEKRKEAGKINSSLFPSVLNTFHTVSKLQKYRQGLLNQSWAIFFSKWKPSSRKKRKRLSQSCRITLKHKSQEKVFTTQEPKERLMSPYYLALYRFLRILPVSERIRLILTET